MVVPRQLMVKHLLSLHFLNLTHKQERHDSTGPTPSAHEEDGK